MGKSKKHKRQPKNTIKKEVIDWGKLTENKAYAFYANKHKKTAAFIAVVIKKTEIEAGIRKTPLGELEKKMKKCIIVSVVSCRDRRNLVGKNIALSHVPSKGMWHLLKENKETGHVYELQKIA